MFVLFARAAKGGSDDSPSLTSVQFHPHAAGNEFRYMELSSRRKNSSDAMPLPELLGLPSANQRALVLRAAAGEEPPPDIRRVEKEAGLWAR